MLGACRINFTLLFWFALSNAAMATSVPQPTGYWVLENISTDTPYGGLKLDKPGRFELLMYDNLCQLYKAEGGIRQKSEQTWVLRNSVDHSNTFIMTKKAQQLQLVDTEGVHMLFSETTSQKLKQGIRRNCQNHQSHNNKAKK